MANERIHYEKGCPYHAALATCMHSPVHIHENDIELVYCLRGSAYILCNHEMVTLREGQIFTIDYKDIHCIFSDQDNCLIVFHIDMNNVYLPKDYLKYVYLGCQDHLFTGTKKQQASLEKVKDTLLAATIMFFRKTGKDRTRFETITNQLVRLLCTDFDLFNFLHDERITNGALHERMHNVIKYCLLHYNEKITMANLAKRFHINENYFSQFMASSTYGSFRNMLGYIRSYEAQYLLLTTSLSILTIAHMCGFSNDKYFYKQFKSWWNKTPQQYRNWIKNYIEKPDHIDFYGDEDSLRLLTPCITESFITSVMK